MSDIFVYDDENPILSEFFQSMKRFIPSFESKAFSNRWIVAIPVKHTIVNEKLSKQYIQAHIFQHSPFYLGQYVSLTGKQAEIDSNYLFVYKTSQKAKDSAVERSCRILEDNEVYNNNDMSQSYRILLLDKPVEGKYISINTSHAGINSLHLKSIDEIESSICNDPAAAPVFTSLTQDLFYLTNRLKSIDVAAHRDELRTRIQSIIDRHTDLMIQTNPNWRQCLTSRQKNLILRACIETFLMNRLYSTIAPAIQTLTSPRDQLIAGYRSWLQLHGGPSPRELSLNPILFAPEVLKTAVHTLNGLEETTCVIQKLHVLWECMRCINRDICQHVSKAYGKEMDLAADDLVPLIALVVLESRVTQLCFTIEFVNEFDFSKLQERELGFCFVSFRVAVRFIEAKAEEWRNSKNRPDFSATGSTSPIVSPGSETPRTPQNSEWSSLMCPIKWSSFQQGDRNIIHFDPTEKTYDEKQFVHASPIGASPKKGSNSVFTQILVKDYLEDSISPEPIIASDAESSSRYWWNSTTTAKRKVVLPWNYPMDAKTADHSTLKPRLSARKSVRLSSIRRTRTLSSPKIGNSIPSASTPAGNERKSYGCWCCWCWCCGGSESGQEGTNGPQSVVDQAVQDPVISLIPAEDGVRDSEKPRVEEARDIGQSNEEERVGYDSGMGSFLENLKKQNGHVSSISWKTI